MNCCLYLFLCLCLFSNCVTFHHNSGKVQSFLPPRDQAKSYKKHFDLHDFDINNFEKEIKQSPEFPYAEYVTPKSLDVFKVHYAKTLILFWNPSCVASKKEFLFAQKLDSMKIPIVLVSVNYSLPNIVSNIQNSRFENRVVYMLSPTHEKKNIVISKIRTFAKEVCSECYEAYMDQLCTTKAIVVTKDTTKLLFRINEQEIEKEFNLH